MKISGFTLVRNGSRFDYPYMESLRSLLPLVDELVINVGIGDDDTLGQVREFAKTEGLGKVVVFESDWQLDNPLKKKGGQILSEQTNLALEKTTGDWCIYLQADEVLHQDDYDEILRSIRKADQRSEVEGIVFNYVHFYGSYNVVQQTRSAYRREVRAVRRRGDIRSVGDAQSFRKVNGEKLKVFATKARVFHYGWVRTPEAMREKTFFMDQLYHGDPTPENAAQGIPHTGNNYLYKRIWGLRTFEATHPSVMLERIKNKGWNWNLKASPLVVTWSDVTKITLDLIERLTGHRFFEYRSYKIVT